MLYNKESIKIKKNNPKTAHKEQATKIQESIAKAAQTSASTGRNSTPNLKHKDKKKINAKVTIYHNPSSTTKLKSKFTQPHN